MYLLRLGQVDYYFWLAGIKGMRSKCELAAVKVPFQWRIKGRGRGGGVCPPILSKKEEMTEGRKANRASKSKLPPPLAQGLDLSLHLPI